MKKKPNKRKYFFRNIYGEFVAVVHGESGYQKTTVDDQDHADYLNESQGVDLADVKAAEVCSIGGKWDPFEIIKSNLQAATSRVIH